MENKKEILDDSIDFNQLLPISIETVDDQTKEENAEDLKTKEMIAFNQKCIDELNDDVRIKSSIIKDIENEIEQLVKEQDEIKDYVNKHFSVFSKNENEKQLKGIYFKRYDDKEHTIKCNKERLFSFRNDIRELNKQISILETEIKRLKGEPIDISGNEKL